MITLTTDVPGLTADSLEIELTGEILTVRGENSHVEEPALAGATS
jgi:HSP20 family molecular chaperone IbpA